MVLIEMHLSNPGGRSQYIWMIGDKWPIPENEATYITRIETFGAEYDFMKKMELPEGREMDGSSYPVRDWLRADAVIVSERMRGIATTP